MNNYGRGPSKDLLCDIILQLDQDELSFNSKVNGQADHGLRTKTDHKNSPYHFVTGELKTAMVQEGKRRMGGE